MAVERFGWGLRHIDEAGGIHGPDSMVYPGSPLEAAELSDDALSGDVGEEALASPPDDADFSGVVDEVSPANLGGVLIQGDPLTTAKALLSWRVDALEQERLSEYDEAAIIEELNALRNRAMGAREYGWTALTDEENEKLQALETFAGHIAQVQAHARDLRGMIRNAPDEPTLGLIDITVGWPE